MWGWGGGGGGGGGGEEETVSKVTRGSKHPTCTYFVEQVPAKAVSTKKFRISATQAALAFICDWVWENPAKLFLTCCCFFVVVFFSKTLSRSNEFYGTKNSEIIFPAFGRPGS